MALSQKRCKFTPFPTIVILPMKHKNFNIALSFEKLLYFCRIKQLFINLKFFEL